MASDVALLRRQQVFVAQESTPGTLVFPSGGFSRQCIAAVSASINQRPEYEDSPVIANSRDILDQCRRQTPPGEWSIEVLSQPAGVPAQAPGEHFLLYGALGDFVSNPGTSAVYSPALSKKSYSIWQRVGHTVLFATGATVNTATITLGSECNIRMSFSGQFMRMGWAGESALTGPIAGTSIPVTDAKLYSVGAKVDFSDGLTTDDNSGAGYTVTAVNTVTNTITVAPAPGAFGADDLCRGWLPDGTWAGSPVEARKGIVEISGVTARTKEFTVTINDDIKYLSDEKTASGYPESYVEGKREVTASMSLYFRPADLKYFYNGLNSVEDTVKLTVGDTAGSILTVDLLRSKIAVPQIEISDPTVGLQTEVKALGSAGEDSIYVTFT